MAREGISIKLTLQSKPPELRRRVLFAKYVKLIC